MTFRLDPKSIFKALSLFVLFLTGLNLVGIVSTALGHGELMGFIPLFDFDHEKNVPTLYSSAALMLSALLLLLIAVQHKAADNSWTPWLGLSAILGFLAVDELAQIHEKLTVPVQSLLNTSGIFYYAWTIPYLLLIGILFLFYFRFLMRLPRRTKYLFITAGTIFITGAVGFEMIGSVLIQSGLGRNTLQTRLIYTCEEVLEMFGVVVFIYALFDYVLLKFKSFSIQVNRHNDLNRNGCLKMKGDTQS